MSGATQYSKRKIFVLVPKQLVSWNHSYHKCALGNCFLSSRTRKKSWQNLLDFQKEERPFPVQHFNARLSSLASRPCINVLLQYLNYQTNNFENTCQKYVLPFRLLLTSFSFNSLLLCFDISFKSTVLQTRLKNFLFNKTLKVRSVIAHKCKQS